MSLAARFNIEFGKDSLVVYDTACKYEACSNPTGYGTPNEIPGTATAATLSVTLPDGTTTPPAVSVYPYLPNDDGTGYEIPYSDFGLTEAPVGEWTFTYTITFSTGQVTKECKFLNTCPVDCCIADRVKKINPSCGGEYDKVTNRLILMVEGALSNHACCAYNKADSIIKEVYALCNSNDCGAITNCDC